MPRIGAELAGLPLEHFGLISFGCGSIGFRVYCLGFRMVQLGCGLNPKP